jgi:hypothetical protein
VWRCLADAEQSREYVELEEGLDLPGHAEAAWQEQQVRQLLREELECLPERLRRVICLVFGRPSPGHPSTPAGSARPGPPGAAFPLRIASWPPHW